MTDEYKEQLLSYVTGNLEIENGIEEPIFNEIEEEQKNIYEYLENGLNTTYFTKTGYLTAEDSSNYLLYGTYKNDSTSPYYAYILIFDENLNPVKLITTYESGTLLNVFETLQIDETGNFYGTDYNSWGDVRRFVLLNNIFKSNLVYDDYTCVLRKSYIYSSMYSDFTALSVFKDYESANYAILGKKQINSTTSYISLITLTINVGSENEWNYYQSTYSFSGSNYGTYAEWEENNIYLKIVDTLESETQPQYREILFSNNTFSINLTFNLPNDLDESPRYITITNIVFRNINEVYFQISHYKNIYKVNYEINSCDKLLLELDDYYWNIKFVSKNNIVFVNMGVRNSLIERSDLYFGIIDSDDNLFFSNSKTVHFIIDAANDFFTIKNNFNYYEFIYLSDFDDYVVSLPIDYNPNNYNGDSYLNYNSLSSHKSEILSDNNLIFARNLYNKTITKNTTNSTIQIPNNMLNNIGTSQNLLLSKTNFKMIDNLQILDKNIYETLYLNFINTITVIDEDTNAIYQDGASNINANINVGTQNSYDNNKIGIVRVNKESSYTFPISWEQIDETHYSTQFSLYVDKKIISIDFMSNDETTIYCSKDLSNLEIGKTYTITQYLRIE